MNFFLQVLLKEYCLLVKIFSLTNNDGWLGFVFRKKVSNKIRVFLYNVETFLVAKITCNKLCNSYILVLIYAFYFVLFEKFFSP